MNTTISIQIQTQPFAIHAEQEALYCRHPRIGALVTFVGLMRDLNDGADVEEMTLEHYPGMTEKVLQQLAAEAEARWELAGVRIVHRVGTLKPTDPIVFVGVVSAHRDAAFRACEFLIDALKTRAPFWKKELTANGERWVEERAMDLMAAQRW